MNNRPVAVDLFAGAGGMSLGFEQAGFDIAAAVELDPVHAATHHFNFPTTHTLAQSVVGLDARAILDACNTTTSKPSVEVVFGGPPCQGFSLMGHRMMDDPRNQLARQFIRLVVELNANYFVFENVKGLTVGKHQDFLGLLINEFREHGYDVAEPWRVLNAKNYGVPQHRERLFLLGARRGLPLPEYPQSVTSADPDLFNSSLVRPIPTCGQALEDLPNLEDFEELLSADSVLVKDWIPRSAYAKELHCTTNASWHLGYRRKWDPSILTSSTRTAHTEISRRRFSETKEGQVEPISRLFKLSLNGQSNTLRAGTDSARGAFTSPRPINYKFNRCVSVREMARLHGYPDWFRFHITKWHGARQIGNSVPPPLARAIAACIMRARGATPQAPRKFLSLGDPDLLKLGMSEASKYWNVKAPIGRRDRKSGARKRKQHEIEEARMTSLGIK